MSNEQTPTIDPMAELRAGLMDAANDPDIVRAFANLRRWAGDVSTKNLVAMLIYCFDEIGDDEMRYRYLRSALGTAGDDEKPESFWDEWPAEKPVAVETE
jgi:hypothetical protein